VPYDNSEHNQIAEGNQLVTVTGADGAKLAMWCDIQQIGDIELPANNSDMPTYDLTMTLTNRNAASPPAETKPAYTPPA